MASQAFPIPQAQASLPIDNTDTQQPLSGRLTLTKQEIESKLRRCIVHQDHNLALKDSFAAAILTEWDEFKSYDWDAIADKMSQFSKIYDGRTILSKKNIQSIYSIGK